MDDHHIRWTIGIKNNDSLTIRLGKSCLGLIFTDETCFYCYSFYTILEETIVDLQGPKSIEKKHTPLFALYLKQKTHNHKLLIEAKLLSDEYRQLEREEIHFYAMEFGMCKIPFFCNKNFYTILWIVFFMNRLSPFECCVWLIWKIFKTCER